MSIEDAQRAAGAAIKASAERDTGSGNGLHVAEITGEGVEINEYDLDEIEV